MSSISIVTAVYNRADTIGHSVRSLQSQTFANYEHIVVDGGSTDGTLEVIDTSKDHRTEVFVGPDDGIYDALNKGKARTTGEIIGVLHSDDMFASENVLELVANAFSDHSVDAVYGDLHYVAKSDPKRIVRNWRSGDFRPNLLGRGWMPPHPAMFLRRSVIERYGLYDTSFRIAADYDAILRYFSQPQFRAVYVPEVFVKMRVGGESNRSVGRILRKSREDYRALRRNKVGGVGTLAMKNLRKLGQFQSTT
ncbi:MAG: glycosyltransferase family 2 protein [Pseudomonadota bacterium]